MLFHNLIDFKKAFDRVWRDGIWRVLKEYNIDNWLFEVIGSFYNEATSALLATKWQCRRFEISVECGKYIHYLQYYLISSGKR